MLTAKQQSRDDLIKYAKALRLQRRRKGKEQLIDFIRYTKEDYQVQWFHEVICYYVDKLLARKIKKLMIFVPPQHGKTEISSRRFPAYALGKNPKEKIILLSYNATKASEFVVDTKRIIKSQAFKEVFPDTVIKGKDTEAIFEINETGFLKGAGMDGGITGTTATIGIIDDPFKGRNEANSQTIRDRVWSVYQDDFKTRLDNDAIQLLLFTRWHEDDIAGRILNDNKSNKYYDAQEASEWTVIALPALKEISKPIKQAIDVDDPRFVGQALWEAKHSARKYELRKKINPSGFNSMDQQRPSAEGGNKIKREHFVIKNENELPFNPKMITPDFFIDGAYTEKLENDESAILACYFYDGKLYILNCHGIRLDLAKFLPYFKTYTQANHKKPGSTVWIEPKASGKDMKSMLSKNEFGNFNAQDLPNDAVKLGKFNRVELAVPFLASEKVILVAGNWNEEFIIQCGSFPNGNADDMVDVLCYAIWTYFITEESDGPEYDG